MPNTDDSRVAEKKSQDTSEEAAALRELAHNIEMTRRARMNASNRLTKSEQFIQNVNIYYSCFAAIISILGLTSDNDALSLISAISTSIVAISIVYFNAQHFGDRAQQFRYNFLELYRLLFRVNQAIRTQEYEQISELEVKYIELLKSVENHIDNDFKHELLLRDKIKRRKDSNHTNKLSGWEKAEFIGNEVFGRVLKSVVWILPIVCIIYIVMTS